jgi:hypothetical protein
MFAALKVFAYGLAFSIALIFCIGFNNEVEPPSPVSMSDTHIPLQSLQRDLKGLASQPYLMDSQQTQSLKKSIQPKILPRVNSFQPRANEKIRKPAPPKLAQVPYGSNPKDATTSAKQAINTAAAYKYTMTDRILPIHLIRSGAVSMGGAHRDAFFAAGAGLSTMPVRMGARAPGARASALDEDDDNPNHDFAYYCWCVHTTLHPRYEVVNKSRRRRIPPSRIHTTAARPSIPFHDRPTVPGCKSD